VDSGHRRGGSVLRTVGDDHEPRAFATYAATAIALIGALPGTLADRSIDISLARRKADEKVDAFRLDRTEALDVLARKAARWAQDNAERIGTIDPQMPAGLYNRAADNWRPLLAIAEAVSGEWPQRAHAAALKTVGGDVDEVSRLELLLGDIRDIFDQLKVGTISSAGLIEKLVEIVPRPWGEYGKSGKAITQNKLARLLKPLAITTELIGTGRISGYKRERFEEAFDRYIRPKGDSNLSPSPNADEMSTSEPSQTSHPKTGREDWKCEKPNNDGLMRSGEVWNGGQGGFKVIGPCDGPCLHCGTNGSGDRPVYLMRGYADAVGIPLHEACAPLLARCAHCGRPGGNLVAVGDGESLHLHRDCERAWIETRTRGPLRCSR
jgi:uncharacterized protein DUF3631